MRSRNATAVILPGRRIKCENGFNSGLQCVDRNVRIVTCGLQCVNRNVRVAMWGLQHADRNVQIAMCGS